ncbi:hypothetical protein JVT61DRAFT_1548 [Boletus reticuloceps]|uniref:Uncharacterized protein n=1 Tax=Boletus reticuloceps TaxID=495285 RepID=A0A8I2YQG5_9AGAM|nr:hypothetical protein JVT61DRAFT_1548 [Boletus reticuloceps]
MDSRTESQLAQLELYLQNLAQVNTQIPRLETSDSLYRFHSFDYDEEWEKDVGLEGAINRELEIRLGSRAKGPIKFKEWGPGLEAVVQVLRQYLTVVLESILLRKWLSDLTEAALLVFKEANLPIPELNTSQGVDSESSVPSPEPTNAVPKQQGAGIKIDATSSSKKAGRSKKRSKPPCDKPATKTLTTFDDSDYDESGESDDNRTGGARTLPLLYKVSKPCRPHQPTKSQIDPKTGNAKKMVRCLASGGCGSAWVWPRIRNHILAHSKDCNYLPADLRREATQWLAEHAHNPDLSNMHSTGSSTAVGASAPLTEVPTGMPITCITKGRKGEKKGESGGNGRKSAYIRDFLDDAPAPIATVVTEKFPNQNVRVMQAPLTIPEASEWDSWDV